MKKFLLIITFIFSILNIQVSAYAAIENLNDIELLSKMIDANKEQNYSTALSCYNEMLKRQPENYQLYNARGMIHLEEYNNYIQALSDFSSAIKYGSKDSSTYTFRGFTRMKLDDLDGAMSDLTTAISINEKNKTPDAFTYCTRALVYSIKGEYKLAISDATTSIKLQPKNPEAFQFRGLAKVALYSERQSLKNLQLAVEGVQSGLSDINYAKEQFLQLRNMEGYQHAMVSYKMSQKTLNILKRELLKR